MRLGTETDATRVGQKIPRRKVATGSAITKIRQSSTRRESSRGTTLNAKGVATNKVDASDGFQSHDFAQRYEVA